MLCVICAVTAFVSYEGPDGRIHNIRDAVADATKGAATVDPQKMNVGPPTYDNLITMSKKDLKNLLVRVRLCWLLTPRHAFASCCLQCLDNQIAALKDTDPQLHGKSLVGELNDFKRAVGAILV